MDEMNTSPILSWLKKPVKSASMNPYTPKLSVPVVACIVKNVAKLMTLQVSLPLHLVKTQVCGLCEVIFEGDDTLQTFGEWFFQEGHEDSTVVAHNLKGYDSMFIMQYLIDQSMRPSKIIYAGTKIMYLERGQGLNIRFIDSLHFLPMKLADLLKAFDLQEMKKGCL